MVQSDCLYKEQRNNKMQMIAFKNNDWIHTSDLSSADLSSFSMVTDPASESDECGSGALLGTAAICVDRGLLKVVTRVTT